MANIDKIIGEILEEAEKKAEEKKQEAQKQREEILEDARIECKKAEEETERRVVAEEKILQERARSYAQMQKRQAVLKARQELISGIVEKAYQKILEMHPEEYFSFLEKMLEKSILPKEGEIFFSQQDLERMPQTFQENIKKLAEKKGGSLTLSTEGMDIDGGFVLVYGGVEENCSLQTIFHTKREYLADKVHEFFNSN